jgi:hypothetical protein
MPRNERQWKVSKGWSGYERAVDSHSCENSWSSYTVAGFCVEGRYLMHFRGISLKIDKSFDVAVLWIDYTTRSWKRFVRTCRLLFLSLFFTMDALCGGRRVCAGGSKPLLIVCRGEIYALKFSNFMLWFQGAIVGCGLLGAYLFIRNSKLVSPFWFSL